MPLPADPSNRAPVPEIVYYTPDGCVDLPYAYVFDASVGNGITNGQTALNQTVQIESTSDFVLRAIRGVPNVVDPTAGGFKLYNYSGSPAMDAFVTPYANNVPIVPEKIYPKSTQLRFDLANALKATRACATAIPVSNIAFVGVKRYRPGTPGYGTGLPGLPTVTDPASYILKPFTYTFNLNLNWFHWLVAATGTLDVARRFTLQIQSFDFELHYITVSNSVSGAALTADLFAAQFYAPDGFTPLSSAPLQQSYWNWNRNAYANPTWPVPPLLFPVWSYMKFDITSLVCNTDGSAPYLLQLCFVGAQRIPKPTTGVNAPYGGGM